MLSVIGKGSYGKVILVKKNDSGELYAMKVLKKSEILKRNQVEHTMTERRILVSKFIESFISWIFNKTTLSLNDSNPFGY
jgi:serine/threonine protein kinase